MQIWCTDVYGQFISLFPLNFYLFRTFLKKPILGLCSFFHSMQMYKIAFIFRTSLDGMEPGMTKIYY